jgi:hypothetical protein
MNNILGHALLAAVFCLLMAAVIPSLDWVQCTRHVGGTACQVQAGKAREAWAGNGATLLAIAVPSGRQR